MATLQEEAHFGRILAAYGGIFVAGSLAWGVAMDGFRPDRFDYIGAVITLARTSTCVSTATDIPEATRRQCGSFDEV